MAFRYQMQNVLDMMLNREKAIDGEVATAKAAFEAEQAKLDEMDARKNAAQKGLTAQMSAGATSDVAASNDYIQALDQRKEVQAKVLKQRLAVLDEVRERQKKAKQERNKIEKHREMKLADWKIDQKKKEAKRTDEMAGQIYMKKRAAIEEDNRLELERLEKIEKLQALRALREAREKKGY